MISRSPVIGLSLALLVPLVAQGAQNVRTGSYIQVDYSNAGTWNNSATRRGHRSRGSTSYSYCDWTYPGSPFQSIAFKYRIGSTNYSYVGNYSSQNYTRVSQSFTNTGGVTTVTDVWRGTGIEITKYEIWRNSSNVQSIQFQVKNTSGSTISNFRISHNVDPDVPSNSSCSITFSTANGTASLVGGSKHDYAYSGSSYMYAGYAACDETKQDIGHTSSWSSNPDDSFRTGGSSSGDWAMNWKHTEASIPPSGAIAPTFMVSIGTTESSARSAFSAWRSTYCSACDEDGDGHLNDDCGGDDCDDTDDTVCPSCDEVCDGKDNDCDDRIDVDAIDADTFHRDADEDGFGDPSVFVRECELPEGYVVDNTDCNDGDDTIYPGAPEVPYDGIDQSCSGDDLCDVDDDGFDAAIGECFGLDCNDDDGSINPRAEEVWYDGVDQNCDGWSDYDADRDGFDSDAHGGDDCDDEAPTVNPDATEIWYDGLDQDCDGWSDYDADRDGFDSDMYGGDDCDDADATVFPGAPSLADGKDNNCDGLTELTDSDGDGIPDYDELRIGTDPHNVDTDGDGLADGFEVGDIQDPTDSDGDGTIDPLDPDDDGDNIPTAVELGPDTNNPVDTDEDGTPDYLDLDSDDDGWSDEIEGYVDTDADGVPDYIDLDSDGDTVLDEDELDEDSDDDGVSNRIDTDDDGDGWSTYDEQSWDPREYEVETDYFSDIADFDPQDIDGDGVFNYLDDDSDGDGRLDIDEGHGDLDCDGLPNVLDPDDFDGPCATDPVVSYQSGACTGASTTAAPLGALGLLLTFFGLAGIRRRR